MKESLVDYMKLVGDTGRHVSVRYDPLRKEKSFTVIVDSYRLCDTDDPLQSLRDWLLGYLCDDDRQSATR